MPTKRRNKKKGTRTHEELLASIARAGRSIKGGDPMHQTASQRSKAPGKDRTIKAPGPRPSPKQSWKQGGLTGTGDVYREPARPDVKVTDLRKKKKGGKSLMSRAYSAVDKSVFGGALPGGAKRGLPMHPLYMDKLVDETSAASKDAKKKKKRRRRSKPIHKR